MLTVMCPNCRHRFSAVGCCEPGESTGQKEKTDERTAENSRPPMTATTTTTTTTAASTCYVGGLLVPHGYTSGGNFINAPTIVHGPAVFQTNVGHCNSIVGAANPLCTNAADDQQINLSRFPGAISHAQKLAEEQQKSSHRENSFFKSWTTGHSNGNPNGVIVTTANGGCCSPSTTSTERHITNTCELPSFTIATPGIQSGGCLIQSTESGILVQAANGASHIEIRPKHNGGGCLVEKRLSTEDDRLTPSNYMAEDNTFVNNGFGFPIVPPSGCSELPGCRRTPFSGAAAAGNIETMSTESRQQQRLPNATTKATGGCSGMFQNLCQCQGRSFDASSAEDDRQSSLPAGNGGDGGGGSGVEIRVNATLQLPASLGQCKVNITATTTTLPATNQIVATKPRVRNNFNGGGIVQSDELGNSNSNGNNERRDGAPTTPVSWLMPCPWSLDTYQLDKDINRLQEVKRLLQTCGWYHEGISWQQSENLLKDAPVGRWLMRDSSDSRYTFAVSVQTARGPTSVRVHYFLERFRLDAEPRLVLAMPLFDCPIRMLEHYVEYSKRMDEHRREVWVDYSGQLYSDIYLTKPLVKEVRSLSHLARLTVNRHKLVIDHLPLSIKNYIAEYPYTL